MILIQILQSYWRKEFDSNCHIEVDKFDSNNLIEVEPNVRLDKTS